MRYQKSPWWRAWLGSRYQMQTHGPAIPAFIPEASAFAEQMATQMGGVSYGVLSEVFLNIPTTAHCMGGISLGNSAADGVVDKYHRLFNYQGFYVCDGSNISTNLGVNPSLTITALTEHAMSHIPHKSTQSPYPADTARQNVTLVQKDANKIPA
jgi:cholesterol oxidase